MSYEEILDGYSCIEIGIEDFPYLLEETGSDLSALNRKLAELFYSIEVIDKKSLENIKITKDGLRFNLAMFRQKICEYFNARDDESLIPKLTRLEKRIKEGVIVEPSISKQTSDAFKQYKMKRYINPRAKKKTVLAARKKEFMQKTRRDMRNFMELVTNEETYSRIDDVFSKDKLGLYIAYRVMQHAKLCEKNNDTDKFKFAYEYLERYLKRNQHLINRDFKIVLEKDKIRKQDNIISIRSIQQYVLSKKETTNETISQDTTPKSHFNYSFFECNGTKAREIISGCISRLEREHNSEELKEILKRKIALYMSLDFAALKIGVESFDGYIGFQLQNGYVILDKLYDNMSEGVIANNNAIYIIREEDFEKITRMSKTETIEAIRLGLIKAKRIIHSGKYEERVSEYIKKKN